ncbi:putative GTP-binding protein engB [Candidatus Methylomirabilis oxygeniifera]|uniref:Probable GTP-binding protein EngB n=1 Tax=Methylomirabilis oxygeniifera TaxID=671143 RepID=D5MJZ5_METO1|nr:putative GTP-binding protein engB [Candidatus Methylomirabilis oxyfera]
MGRLCYTNPVKILSAEFVTSVSSLAQLPREPRAEIAVVGRSNVGKSSLINCLLRRRGLARVSGVPGRTQLLNFFLINRDFYLVDLPGYGYAKVPDSIRLAWGPLIEGYLASDRDLRVVIVLIDARQGVTEKDLQMKGLLDNFSINWIPVLTKIDKLRRTARQAHIRDAVDALGLRDPRAIIPFSAKSEEGRESLLAVIGDYAQTRPLSMGSALTPTSGPARLGKAVTDRS